MPFLNNAAPAASVPARLHDLPHARRPAPRPRLASSPIQRRATAPSSSLANNAPPPLPVTPSPPHSLTVHRHRFPRRLLLLLRWLRADPAGIHVTLYHLDFPQILEDDYHGWLSPRVVEDFTAYADVCFREFGDRVTHWTTMDEPNVISIATYDSGAFPPCRCSAPFGWNCTVGNLTVEPYVVAHNSILALASVVKLYREKYQATQKGVVGMNVYSFWNYPFSPSFADIAWGAGNELGFF